MGVLTAVDGEPLKRFCSQVPHTQAHTHTVALAAPPTTLEFAFYECVMWHCLSIVFLLMHVRLVLFLLLQPDCFVYLHATCSCCNVQLENVSTMKMPTAERLIRKCNHPEFNCWQFNQIYLRRLAHAQFHLFNLQIPMWNVQNLNLKYVAWLHGKSIRLE